MLFGVGIYHPEPGTQNVGIKGYDLSRQELQSMNIAGLPLTIEHNGIVKAVQLVQALEGPLNAYTVGAAMDLLAETVKKNTVVGYVQRGVEGVDNKWYCAFAIDNDSYPIVPMLIKSGTHAMYCNNLFYCMHQYITYVKWVLQGHWAA